MSLGTERLLKFHPLAALLILINQSTGLRLNPNQIRARDVRSLGGTKTEVTLEHYDSGDEHVEQIYSDSGKVKYDRLDVADFFGASLKVKVNYPVTTMDLMKLLYSVTGIVFDEGDFEPHVARTSPFLLKASSSSLRWIGQVAVGLEETDEEQNLRDIILNDQLSGFYIYKLDQDIRQTELDGFYIAKLNEDIQKTTADGFILPQPQ